MRTGSGGKGRERVSRHYLCRQVHIGYTTVSPSMQADCLWLSCENRGTCVRVSEDLGHGEGAGAHATLLTDTRRRVVSLATTFGYNDLNTVPTCRRNRNRKGEKEGHVSSNPLYL